MAERVRPTYRSDNRADLEPIAARWTAEKRAGIEEWVVAEDTNTPWRWTILPAYRVAALHGRERPT